VSYDNEVAAPGTPATIKIGDTVIPSYASRGLPADEGQEEGRRVQEARGRHLKAAGYPAKADPARWTR
jgi:hypothetical protein